MDKNQDTKAGDLESLRSAMIAEVQRIFDQMENRLDPRTVRGALFAVAYSEDTCGDGVAFAVKGRPSDNIVLLGAAHILCDEVSHRIGVMRR